MTHIWGVKMNVNRLQENLEDNWRKLKFTLAVETYVDLDIRGYVEAASSKQVAVRSYVTNDLSRSKIVVYDVSSNVAIELKDAFQFVKDRAEHQEFGLVLSDNLVAVRVPVRAEESLTDAWSKDTDTSGMKSLQACCDDNIEIIAMETKSSFNASADKKEQSDPKYQIQTQNLQVFSTFTGRKMLDEDIHGLDHFDVSRTSENPEFLVLFGLHTEILKFADDNLLCRIRIEMDNALFSIGRFSHPHIILTSNIPPQRRSRVTVWKMVDKLPSVQTKIEIPDVVNYFHARNRQIVKFAICEVNYFNYFLCAGRITEVEGRRRSRRLVVRVFSDDGLFLHEYKLSTEYNPHGYIKFLTFKQRLFIEVENDVLVYQDDLDNVANPQTPLIFNKMEDVVFVTDLMVNNIEGYEVRMHGFHLGYQMLRITSGKTSIKKKQFKLWTLSQLDF